MRTVNHGSRGKLLGSPFSRNMHACCHFIHVQFFVTPWTVACQALLSMVFSWQEYWSGLPCLLPLNLHKILQVMFLDFLMDENSYAQ